MTSLPATDLDRAVDAATGTEARPPGETAGRRDRRSVACRRIASRGPVPTISHKPWLFSRLEPGKDCRRWARLLDCRVPDVASTPNVDVIAVRSTMSRSRAKTPWYRDGLAFSCTRCGACCTGAPGYVWVTAEEIAQLAEFRGESVEAFSHATSARSGDHFSLIERPGRRLHLLGQGGRVHGLSRAARPVPDLAVLARERRDPGRLGARHRRSAPARGRAAFTQPRRSSSRSGWSGHDRGAAPDGPRPGRARRFASGPTCSRSTASSTTPWPRHGPVCELSGRCCRFHEYGHTLFLPLPEAAVLIADAPPPGRDLDDGDSCPWQDRPAAARRGTPARWAAASTSAIPRSRSTHRS